MKIHFQADADLNEIIVGILLTWDHMHNAPMSRPLLVLDMYEHAYHMDYGAAAAKYIDAFMQNVKWEEVNRRAEEALARK